MKSKPSSSKKRSKAKKKTQEKSKKENVDTMALDGKNPLAGQGMELSDQESESERDAAVDLDLPVNTKSVSALVDEANKHLEIGETAEALEVIGYALKYFQKQLPLWNLYAEINMELGNEEEVVKGYKEALDLDPDGQSEEDGGGPEKIFMLAQFSDNPRSSLQWYERGIKAIRAWKRKPFQDPERDFDGKLCAALCSCAELYMTPPLCDEHDAEKKCQQFIAEALLAQPDSTDALQNLASLRVVQSRIEDAKSALSRAVEVIKSIDPDSPSMPAFGSRINLCRLLIETGLYAEFLDILDQLQLEDDENVDLLYLAGWCTYLVGANARENGEEEAAWKESWQGSRTWLKACLKAYNRDGWNIPDILEHVTELLVELNHELGPQSKNEADEEEDNPFAPTVGPEDDEDVDWEDADDETMEEDG